MVVINKFETPENAAVIEPTTDERLAGGTSENWLAPIRRDISDEGFDAGAAAKADADAAAQEELEP